MDDTFRCPVCQTDAERTFAEVRDVPVHVGVLWPSRDGARSCRRGDIVLAFCEACGFIWNVEFDPNCIDYTQRYDNALHFSSVFRAFEDELAVRLIERFGLHGKNVVEVGAGTGHFLGLLCDRGENTGTGYDPSHDPAHADVLVGDRVAIVPDYFSEKYASGDADLICCRHVLEHIQTPRPFVEMLRRCLHEDAFLYLEVPSANLVLRDLSVWDVIYEHCNHFLPETLEHLLIHAGFEVLHIEETYGGQFVGVEARVARDGSHTNSSRGPLEDARARVDAFGNHLSSLRGRWTTRLEALEGREGSVVLWGGGAKCVTFTSLIDAAARIPWVVDKNPNKWGTHLTGGGQEIIAPERLREIRPELVIVMNPVYTDEIRSDLAKLGLSPKVESVR